MLFPLHLGSLHSVEWYVLVGLTLLPFVVLALVVFLASRRDRRPSGHPR